MKLVLSVTRLFEEDPSDIEKKSLIKEQKGRCAACGIDIRKNTKYEQVKDKNGDLKNYALCAICYSSQHLEELPPASSGSIIMMSDISQVELIALSRMIALIKRLDADNYDADIDSASMIEMLMESNKEQSDIYYATGASDVELLAQMLSNQSDKAYAKREKGLFNLKWLPDYSLFEKELDYWFETMFAKEDSRFHPDKWESLKNKLNKQ